MKKLFHISFVFLLSLMSAIVYGQDFDMKKLIDSKPAGAKLVNDYTDILSDIQKDELERKLERFDDTSSTQIVVVIVPNLGGEEIVDAATELGRSWKVGQKENNNGVVLLVCMSPHGVAIAPGNGLEAALPDAICKEIIDEYIVPGFKENDYYRGINDGTDQIINAARGVYVAPAGYHKKKSGSIFGRILGWIIIIVIILAILAGKSGGGSFMSSSGWAAWTIGSILGGGGGSSGGGGGGGGGGFGGFGGGSFGGGGASGSW